MLPPEGALRRPLNSEDVLRSLQFRKYNTKFINIRLRDDSFLQSHKITATDARTAPRSVPPALKELLLLLESTRTQQEQSMWGPYTSASHDVGGMLTEIFHSLANHFHAICSP